MRTHIRQVFGLFFILFLLLAVYLGKIIFFDADVLAANSYNRRMSAVDINVERGEILSSQEEILACSEAVYGGGYLRKYPFSNEFSHITGFAGLGKSGVELKYNFQLQRLSNEIRQRIGNLVTGGNLQADDCVLTIDSDIQRFVYERLKASGFYGGVVVLNAGTGAVLAMCSAPDYDPNETPYEWSKLLSNEATPLLNRAAQGLYPPGSTFKLVTAAAIIENYSEYNEFVYECTGKAVFKGDEIKCFNSTAHGNVDLQTALILSCNCYFAAISEKIDIKTLKETSEAFLFNKPLQYPLEYSLSSFSANEDSSNKEFLDTYYGQGKTLATPLIMALCAGAVVNGGVIMKPYILDYTKAYDGGISNKAKPQALSQAVLPETAELLKNIIVRVVEEGTGKAAGTDGLKIGGKTGTAQNSSGTDHSWFIGFLELENGDEVSSFSVSVLLENTGGGSKATEMAGEIFRFISER